MAPDSNPTMDRLDVIRKLHSFAVEATILTISEEQRGFKHKFKEQNATHPMCCNSFVYLAFLILAY